ncbi:hypothetical protein MLD38_024055 [Melastoma candidum]|uniref:Uncharacterized protein n=1 Tax=Melastoma candidum TaxID=119954 RepID=A0ACB9NR66_9MYRT|nr:hypothetical protein MLD38_024055 [Melastoma candidum]
MRQGLCSLLPIHSTPPPPSLSFPINRQLPPLPRRRLPPLVAATAESPASSTALTAKERRQLRNQKREAATGHSWRDEVEQRLIKKPKKRRPSSWTEDLNLDNLSFLGPRWYILKVSRVRAHVITDSLARSLCINFPDLEFKLYSPSIKEKRKLKNGSLSVKERALFPGCIFLNVVLNRELHDFIRDCDGVGGFVGSKVGSTKRQINRPRPISTEDIEGIFKKAKQEQEKADQAFQEDTEPPGVLESKGPDQDLAGDASIGSSNLPQHSKKSSKSGTPKLPAPGSTVQVISGTFSGFQGNLMKFNRKTKKATVGLTLFGKESMVELDMNEIVTEANLTFNVEQLNTKRSTSIKYWSQ